MADVLQEIVARTRQRVEMQKKNVSLQHLKKRWKTQKPVRPFSKSLHAAGGIAVIAELKQASPSAGVIRKEQDIEGRIQGYTRGGAAALSILTEEFYFHGSPHLLEFARQQTHLPLLRKDFIVDPYQIDESRAIGADAILLITTLLTGDLLKKFLAHTNDMGMEALVEIHDEQDLEQALKVEAPLIGVNNRNLRTLRVDPTTSKRLVPLIPQSQKTIVVESGIRDPQELPRIRGWGAHAVLIGETLMRDPNPEAIVRAFVQAGQPLPPSATESLADARHSRSGGRGRRSKDDQS